MKTDANRAMIEKLNRARDAMRNQRFGDEKNLWWMVGGVLASAEENANDTFAGRDDITEDSSEYWSVYATSIGCSFDSHTPKAVTDWFKRQGYSW